MLTSDLQKRLTGFQQLILQTIINSGGKATTREVANKINRSVNGVSQGFGSLNGREIVTHVGGKDGDTQWQVNAKIMTECTPTQAPEQTPQEQESAVA